MIIITAKLIAIAMIAILTMILVKEGSFEKASRRAMKNGRFRSFTVQLVYDFIQTCISIYLLVKSSTYINFCSILIVLLQHKVENKLDYGFYRRIKMERNAAR